ncbi:SusC/RagA family TonB-linked outer membrane protein [Prevotella melaninogenica]|uniref:SusC/RagA family TonB-linked outer membrane protein n=1 Tax=Prevotella melaninogenica TaxID=28132 RepID=A0A250KJN3_9BACT|nr:TonB-dependent receptor [Prevotella melaninogenica]BBA29871.1 SusC/RagA family TonB-linked outer membrane protein [Prevotella melaninogenica]
MRRTLYVLCLMVALLTHAGYAYSQDNGTAKQFSVAGVILDDTGEPCIGATVRVKNEPGVGTISDVDGKFAIKVKPGATLMFEYVGMETIQRTILKDEPSLSVKFKVAKTNAIDEVVVTGLVSQKKVSVVGAVSTINMEELRTPGTSLVNMIGGRMPGVITMQVSGEPGQNLSNFWVRGVSTFGAGAGALVLIDGIEGRLNDIDVDDVESISVLKDAAATAVYGVRGANGVVLVTTKRGSKEKIQITARATVKLSQIKRLPEYLSSYDYARLANEARAMSGESDLYTPIQLDIIKNNLDPELYPNVNWIDQIMKKTSLQENYYASARGGGDVAQYFVSLGYRHEGAAYKQKENQFHRPLSYDQLTYRANINMNLTKRSELYFGVDGSISNHTTPGGKNTNQVWSDVLQLNPLMFPVTYADGTLPTYGQSDLISPFAALNYQGYNSSDYSRNMITLKFTHRFGGILKGLVGSVQAVNDRTAGFSERRFVSPDYYRATGRTATGDLIKTLRSKQQDMRYSSNNDSWRKYYMEAKLDYNTSFGAHNLGALLFYYMEDAKGSEWGNGDALGIAAIAKRRQNVSGRLSWGYNSTYFVDANFGYTGSDLFPKGERFGFFPSVAVGWAPTSYKWVQKHLPFVNFFKIRGSYGLAGNDNIANTRFPYLTIINNHAGTTWGYTGQGIVEKQQGADNLKWEVAKKLNVGVDANFFNDAIKVTVDFFRDTRDHIFQDRVTLPEFAGMVTYPKSNVGRMHSFGSDGNISYFHKINKEMNFTVRANYTWSQNIVDYFEENKLAYDYQSVTGMPYGVLRGYVSEGLFKDEADIRQSPDQTAAFGVVRPGDIKYRDVNGDGVINKDDRVPLSYGNNVPRVMFGLGGEFNYKDFTVSLLFKGNTGVNYYRVGMGHDAGWIPFYNGEMGNVLKMVNNPKNRWIPSWYSGDPSTENPNAMFPRLSYGSNNNNSQLSTFWKQNGSFLRFQELNFRYVFRHRKWLRAAGLSALECDFVINNLFTIDSAKYFDPEQAWFNGAAYPIPTTYSLQMYFRF